MPWNPEPLPLSDPDPRAQQVMVGMRDGVRLATDVYLPGARPAPVILVRTCYDKSSWLTFLPLVAEYVNDRGYCLVAQDVRGKGRSEGPSEPFVHEVDDGYDTLDWLAAQEWCDGRIGMLGDSYFAYTAWAAAASGHPALGAMVSRGIATDIAREVVYRDGTFMLATNAFWAPYWLDQYVYDVAPPIDWSSRPLDAIIGSWLPGRRSEFFDSVRKAAPDDPFWNQPCFELVRRHRPTIPCLHVGGWWEDFHRGQIRDWGSARAVSQAPQYLVMDCTDHFDAQLQPDDMPLPDFRETEEGLRGYLPRYLDDPLEFFDRELLGQAGEPIPAVRVEVAEAGWWSGGEWPPAAAEPMRLFLEGADEATNGGATGGRLAVNPPQLATEGRWTHDPNDLVPSLDEVPFRDLVVPPPDERAVESRPDVLTFTADAAADPLDLVGPVEVQLGVTADSAMLQVAVKLVDVFPGGRARRITDGCYTGPATSGPVSLVLPDIAYRLRTGHRLRVEVAASAFPRYLPLIGESVSESWTAATGRPVTYVLAADGASRIDLLRVPDLLVH